MPHDDDLARAFEHERPRLLRVAYSTTGSLAEAEDCVQESWLRLRRVPDPGAIRDLRGWLTTVVGRLALDALGSARSRRERYVGTWLPEPLVEPAVAVAPAGSADPAEQVTLDESVSMALLVVLDELSPAQRTAFLLHDVFGLPFTQVAEVVGRTPAAVRQLASRARRHVEQSRPHEPAPRAEQWRLVRAFAAACQEGDLEGLVRLLDPEVAWRGDGGGLVPSLPGVVRGAEQVARGLVAFGRGPLPPGTMRVVTVNGAAGLVLYGPEGEVSVAAFTVNGGRITSIGVQRNPEKLTSVRFPQA
ncbi:RNA polymerase sigma factor SigJ [Streptomyces sp. CMB-StM0423]|uniref:RNA polymerase sigma factor SigJ n=1 Tax=Streptomyces sp. CMB-StM0423 TaxID=2059884 RepID=UPI000C70EA6D|nr:RNA polymerase sigma factor SigJ [Streptomyces sp. CMB-StM0423]AUH44773.1 RNA polymerase sigma-70 factor [Streptomyces sp. CMB-StM0423]